MEVFIDTNVFLSFYHLTSEDLVELEKLVLLIKNKEIRLYLPEQVLDETKRNRANKINDSFDAFKKIKLSLPYPAYCKDYAQYEQMRVAQKQLEEAHSQLIAHIQEDVSKQQLNADKLIEKLFSHALLVKRTPQIILKARERMDLGNPPGKKGSLGDAINWESLLEKVPETFRLFIIADDSDFSSPLNSNKINEFLLDEWKTKKKADLYFYRKISAFFKVFFPDINLKTEEEKDALIERLASSSSFAETHAIIAALSKFTSFAQKQAEDLLNVLLLNNQVRWIGDDDDVRNFYEKIIDNHGYLFLHQFNLDEVQKTIGASDEVLLNEIPF